MRSIKIFILIMLTMLQINFAAAEIHTTANRTYEIDMIVFLYTHTPNDVDRWPDYHPTNLSHAVDLTFSENNAPTFAYPLYHMLPYSLFALRNEQKHLEQDSDIEILLHNAWLQNFSTPGRLIRVSATTSDSETPILSGYVTLSQNDSNDFTFRANLNYIQSGAGNLKAFPLRVIRKMKFNVLNYVDSKYIGVLVMVKPWRN